MDSKKNTDKTKVAALREIFPGHPYLMVEDGRGGFSEGGNQNWWSRKTKITGHKGITDGLKKKMRDRSYRLWKGGCGVIALCDMELYLAKLRDVDHLENGPDSKHKEKNPKQNGPDFRQKERIPEHKAYDQNHNEINSSHKDQNLGQKSFPHSYGIEAGDYMSYVEKRYASRYVLWANPVDCTTGLQPWKMIYGFWRFVREGAHPYKRVVWAKHCLKPRKWQKKAVLSDIERMLSRNIPVVFSCHRFGKKHDTGLYRTLEEAGNGKPPETVNGHYMTVVSLHKSPSFEGKYILKVISWGKIYYVDYDEYASGLNFFHNILTVKVK